MGHWDVELRKQTLHIRNFKYSEDCLVLPYIPQSSRPSGCLLLNKGSKYLAILKKKEILIIKKKILKVFLDSFWKR